MSDTAPLADHSASLSAAMDVVRRFFGHLEDKDVSGAVDLLSEDAVWINVSLPPIQGRDRVRSALAKWLRTRGSGFEVYFHKMAVDGESVLMERTDVLIFGPVRIQIWVWGRFDIADGRITMWKDYFDWWAMLVATGRGVLGAAVPALAPRPPAEG